MLFKIIIFVVAFTMMMPAQVMALAIDEKLPLRILKVSDSKKTLLVNRGLEDGLVKGDFAKFFLTTGVVARGVLVKASPSRSVWSLYKITNESELVTDKVMNLKITEAVKLTNDVSKMFEEESVQKPPEGIVLAEGADDGDKGLNPAEKKELQHVSNPNDGGVGTLVGTISNRTLEFWGTLHFSSLSSTNSAGTNGGSTNGSAKGLDSQIGVEKYFLDYNSWYGKFSFTPFVHYTKEEYSSLQGHTVSTSVTALGIGVNWHFDAPPLAVNRLIIFVGGAYGVGNSTDSANLQVQTNTQTLPSMTGQVSFFSLGGGLKYYLPMGIGFRLALDYYRRVEDYKVESSVDDYTKVVSGPRILLGLSYRF